MTGLGPDMSQGEILRLARSPSGVADLLEQEHPSTGDSPAEIMADIINVQRADNKKIAEQHGIELEIEQMTPARAAELLAGTINGDGVALVMVFNELAEQRDEILQAALDDDEYQRFTDAKHAMMNSTPEDDGE